MITTQLGKIRMKKLITSHIHTEAKQNLVQEMVYDNNEGLNGED